MKSILHRIALPVTALILLCGTQVAPAFYDPGVQRWINRDPIDDPGFAETHGPRGHEPNLYELVRNNPVNFVDPQGLATWGAGPCWSLAFAMMCSDICASQGLLPDCHHVEDRSITPTSGGFIITVAQWDECSCKPPPPKPPPPGGPTNCTRNGPPPIIFSGPRFPPGGPGPSGGTPPSYFPPGH